MSHDQHLNLDQSGTSIQILPKPNTGHVTRFYKITTLKNTAYKKIILRDINVLFVFTGHNLFKSRNSEMTNGTIYTVRMKELRAKVDCKVL